MYVCNVCISNPENGKILGIHRTDFREKYRKISSM